MFPSKYRQMVLDAGFKEIIAVRRSKHWVVKVAREDGSVTSVSFPSTPSDHRALRNKASQLRHIVQE